MPNIVRQLICLVGVSQVALRDRLEELTDSQLAPAVAAGGRVAYVPAYGDRPVPATVIAANIEQW